MAVRIRESGVIIVDCDAFFVDLFTLHLDKISFLVLFFSHYQKQSHLEFNTILHTKRHKRNKKPLIHNRCVQIKFFDVIWKKF